MWCVIAFAPLTCFGGIFPFFLHLLNCLHLNPWVFSHVCLSNPLPHPAGRWWKQLCGCLAAGQSQPTTIGITVTSISSQGWLCCGGSVLSLAYVCVISLAYEHKRMSHHHLKYWWRSILHHFLNMLQTGLYYHSLWCSVIAYLWLTVQRSMSASIKDAFGEVWGTF